MKYMYALCSFRNIVTQGNSINYLKSLLTIQNDFGNRNGVQLCSELKYIDETDQVSNNSFYFNILSQLIESRYRIQSRFKQSIVNIFVNVCS